MIANWAALLMASLLIAASAFTLWWVRKERAAGVRLNFFSLIHSDGQPWPPFSGLDYVMPMLLAVAALAMVAKFLVFSDAPHP